MKSRLICFAIFVSIAPNLLFAQMSTPKREFRGAWIATVINLDWPSSPHRTEAEQRIELIRILDELHVAGINAVFFQIRAESDAFYKSEIEPWSYWLTGSQGNAPAGFYDPLEFAIEEAHKRGMELHAWFNPYRAVREIGSYARDSLHVSVRHPDWLLTFNNIQILDPGLPAVRDYVTSVIMDVVRRYDIDGVHFDDFFYPYPPNQISSQDASTFQNYNRGFTNIGDWRRDNVNLFVAMVYDSIQIIKPYVKFGISPFGIWRNGVPSGIVGLDAYSTIYADPLAWLAQEKVDYLAPQLYWPFGGGQDYGKLQPWWALEVIPRHLYIGQGAYRISIWPAGEIQNQLALNRSNPDVQGSIFFRALFFRENPRGFADYLRDDHFRHIALPPQMAWKDGILPSQPRNLRYERIAGTGTAALSWDIPETAADGDSATRYVVYQFDRVAVSESDFDDPANIIGVSYQRGFLPEASPTVAGPTYFAATALDRNANESVSSNLIQIVPPAVPLLAMPIDGALQQPDDLDLLWHYPRVASAYHVQVSADSIFSENLLLDETGILDTAAVVFGMEGQQKYFWRVRAGNPGGASDFSQPFSFTTGFPTAPLLAAPPTNTGGIPIDVQFSWRPALAATAYHFQAALSANFAPNSFIADVEGVVDTSYMLSQLEPDRFHFWRVRAGNAIGVSQWSETWRFKTGTATRIAENMQAPLQFELLQNYPNPFNPRTVISFSLAHASTVQLKVFDILGREVEVLIDRAMQRGRHEVVFDGSDLPSGVYYYRLIADKFVSTRKMALLR